MGAIMIEFFDQMPSVAFFKANADKLGQNFEMEVNSLSSLNSVGIEDINSPNFELSELTEAAFIENVKAYTFNYGGINCAYLMIKVLSSADESMWLAWELRQFKDSWFFDSADVTWLSLKVSESNGSVLVDDFKIFPIALLTQFKDSEINTAFANFPLYLEKISLLRKCANWIEHCFDPKQSLAWLWTLAKFGYCLSQYSSEVLVQPNSGINVKNQQLPFVLSNGDAEYKALSLAIQVGNSDNNDCFWLTTLFNSDGQAKTDGFIISYGHYPNDLPVRKLVAPNLVEKSIFLKNNEDTLGEVQQFLKSLMLEKNDIDDYLLVMKGVLATYLDQEFQSRLLYSCHYEDKVDVLRLGFDEQDSLNEFLESCDPFVSNLPIYQNTTSFPESMYVPNMENSLLEDIPDSLKVLPQVDTTDKESIYDEQQPDFNTENRLGVMQTPRSNDSFNTNYSRQSKRILDTSPMAMNAKHSRGGNIDDVDSAMDNNDRKKRHQKSKPVVVHRRRWGLVAKERRDQIEQELSGNTIVGSAEWDDFKKSVSQINNDSLHGQEVGVDVGNSAQQYEQYDSDSLVASQIDEPVVAVANADEPVLPMVEVDEPVVAVAKVGNHDSKLIIEMDGLDISMSESLVVTLKPHNVVINYPKNLIDDDFNYIFNQLIALGVDPYESRDAMIAINAPINRFSYAKVSKMVKQASVEDLKLYKGFEYYIDLVDRELKCRT